MATTNYIYGGSCFLCEADLPTSRPSETREFYKFVSDFQKSIPNELACHVAVYDEYSMEDGFQPEKISDFEEDFIEEAFNKFERNYDW